MSGLLFSQSETTLFFRALNHAVIAHRGQKREGTDFPYVTHPITAARCIAEETEYPVTPQLIVAALLHDILEDTDEIIESFPEDVRNLVLLVTDPDREEGHRLRAVERIFGNPDAILLKMGIVLQISVRRTPSVRYTGRWMMSGRAQRRCSGQHVQQVWERPICIIPS